jgi:hypothetical protein
VNGEMGEGLTTTIDHDARMMFWSRLFHPTRGTPDVLVCEVGTFGAPAENDVHVMVPLCADYGC